MERFLFYTKYLPGFVIKIQDSGYPQEWDVDCIEPSGYNTQWRDQIWLEGRWKGLDANSIECIDPLRCYKSPSPIPVDYTVEANLTGASDLIVNTTIFYKCSKESKFTFSI
jgi:hypothetical protein